jgi:hypothetical protein
MSYVGIISLAFYIWVKPAICHILYMYCGSGLQDIRYARLSYEWPVTGNSMGHIMTKSAAEKVGGVIGVIVSDGECNVEETDSNRNRG